MTTAAVVLAAGFGRRLAPLTQLRPKALCPLNNEPLLEWALARIGHYEVGHGEVVGHCGVAHRGLTGPAAVAVNAHHHAAAMRQAVGDRATFSCEVEPLGTAGALGALRGWIDGRDVLVTNADSFLWPNNLDVLRAGWDRQRPRLLVRAVGQGRQADFSGGGDRRWRYIGACFLPWSAVARLAEEPAGLYEALWRQAWVEQALELVEFDGIAIDCGTPADYLRANLVASGGDAVIGAGAQVLGTVRRSVVWDGAFVGPDEHLNQVIRAGDASHPVTVAAEG